MRSFCAIMSVGRTKVESSGLSYAPTDLELRLLNNALAFFNSQQTVSLHFSDVLNDSRWPSNGDTGGRLLTKPEVKLRVVHGIKTRLRAHFLCLYSSSLLQGDSSTNSATIRLLPNEFYL